MFGKIATATPGKELEDNPPVLPVEIAQRVLSFGYIGLQINDPLPLINLHVR